MEDKQKMPVQEAYYWLEERKISPGHLKIDPEDEIERKLHNG